MSAAAAATRVVAKRLSHASSRTHAAGDGCRDVEVSVPAQPQLFLRSVSERARSTPLSRQIARVVRLYERVSGA